MNKVQQINLGGVPFTIDEDAYEHLNRYLKSIHRHFSNSEGYEEITHDIEARMAELFQEHLGSRPIVTLKDVENAIVIMGTPEDFGADPMDDEPVSSGGTNKGNTKQRYRTGKRLFLNPDDEIVGGVCSGIAAYLGIADPLWVRIAFIIITISGGFGIPAYLILWAILPKAETASDRLAMRGESINVSNIGKIIEEELEHLSHKVSEIGEELSGKKKGPDGSGGIGEVLRRGISLLGKGIRALIELLKNVWIPLLIIVGGALILASAISWVTTVAGVVFAWPLIEFFTPEQPLLAMLSAFNVLAIIGLIMLALVLFIYRLLYGTRMSSPWRAGLTAFWILNVVSFFLVASFWARNFSEGSSSNEPVIFGSVPADVLQVSMTDFSESESWFNIDNEFKLTNDGLSSRMIKIHLEKAEGDQFELTVSKNARGMSNASAFERAESIVYQPQLTGDQLVLPSEVVTPHGQKWRVQTVDLILKVPVGKSIQLTPEAEDYLETAEKADNDVYFWKNPGQTWTMTEEGLICPTCEGYSEKPSTSDNHQSFSRIHIEGPIKVEIQQDEDYNVYLEGNNRQSEQVDISQDGEALHISADIAPSSVSVFISLPELSAISTENTSDVRIRDFSGDRLEINSRGGEELKAEIQYDSLYITQEDGQEVDIRGSIHYLNANISDHCQLDADRADIQSANINAQDNSQVELNGVPDLRQQIDESSEIDLNN